LQPCTHCHNPGHGPHPLAFGSSKKKKPTTCSHYGARSFAAAAALGEHVHAARAHQPVAGGGSLPNTAHCRAPTGDRTTNETAPSPAARAHVVRIPRNPMAPASPKPSTTTTLPRHSFPRPVPWPLGSVLCSVSDPGGRKVVLSFCKNGCNMSPLQTESNLLGRAFIFSSCASLCMRGSPLSPLIRCPWVGRMCAVAASRVAAPGNQHTVIQRRAFRVVRLKRARLSLTQKLRSKAVSLL
jgi:hypothetical protein